MKFCENLQNLRKKKNISQEQLAEMLGVTRQSVSKWESGASYPEMEKLTEMCKIFHCSLDTLVNGDALEETEKKNNNIFYSMMSSLELSVKKTIAMLETMTASEVIKFLFTLLIIVIVILICKIPFVILEDSMNYVFHTSNMITNILGSLWSFLLNLAYGILAIFSFLYIYKIKYLDRIELTEDDEQNIKIEKENITVHKQNSTIKEKKYIYQENSGIFDFLTTLLMAFVKFICAIILIWDLCALVTSLILFVLVIILAIKGLLLIGPIFIGIGVILFTIMIATLLFNFIANRQSNHIIVLSSLFTSIILGSIGVALSLWYFANLTYIDGLPEKYQEKLVTATYDMKDDLIIGHHYNIEYVEDATLQNQVRVDLKYYYQEYNPKITLTNNKYISYQLEEKKTTIYPKEFVDDIIDNLKEKRIYTYEDCFEAKMVITSSKENIQKLKTNVYYEYYYDEDNDPVEEQKSLENFVQH